MICRLPLVAGQTADGGATEGGRGEAEGGRETETGGGETEKRSRNEGNTLYTRRWPVS